MGLLLMMGIAVAVRSAIKLVVRTNQVALKIEEMQLAPPCEEARDESAILALAKVWSSDPVAGMKAAHKELSKKTQPEVATELYELIGIPQ